MGGFPGPALLYYHSPLSSTRLFTVYYLMNSVINLGLFHKNPKDKFYDADK